MTTHQPDHTSLVKPFLKWAGGKTKMLRQYAPLMPQTLRGRHYVEPFMGSAALFFYVVQNLEPARCTLMDINPELVNAFQQVQQNVEELIGYLTEHKARHNAPGITLAGRQEYYYSVRAQQPHQLTAPQRAARFIYLNKTCYNGLHRLNSSGEFNVPMGSYIMPGIFRADHLRAASGLLTGVTISECPFQECEKVIGAGDFVYFDPPYAPISATSSFTTYSATAFTSANQVELRDLALNLSGKCDCMISNSATPLIEEMYAQPPFRKHYVTASRLVNSKAAGRGKIGELVITAGF